MLQGTTNNVVSKLSTKINNMNQRRVVNAANAVNKQDYITLNDLQTRLSSSAYTDTTDAGNITNGTLPNKVIPYPTTIALGGVKAINVVSGEYIQGIDKFGNPQLGSVSAANVSGLAPSATIDTTNASNITSGVMAPAQLPPVRPVGLIQPSRALGTVYQNTTAYPIFVNMGVFFSGVTSLQEVEAYEGTTSSPGNNIARIYITPSSALTMVASMFFIVISMHYYRVALINGTSSLNFWWEWN